MVLVYLVLYMIAAKRLRGRERERSTDVVFWLVVVLVSVRIVARFTSLGGLAYQFVVALPGIAAGVGIPGLMKELARLKADNGKPGDGNEERIGSRTLS
ncbi:MAG: hypothetical protein WA628_09775 [Terriglobales bacterium]